MSVCEQSGIIKDRGFKRVIKRIFSTAKFLAMALVANGVIGSMAVYAPEASATTQVHGVRVWKAPDHTRFVFDLNKAVSHQVFTLDDPHRVVIDLKKSSAKKNFNKLDLGNTPVTQVRTARQDNGDLRIVLDAKEALQPKSFVLPPNQQYGHRLVLDLYDKSYQPVKTEQSVYKSVVTDSSSGNADRSYRDIVVAIDAGHGGEDPGASGPNGTKEKTVVLQIARELANQLKREKGIRPVLIRDGDYYLKLDKRRLLASEKYNADMFISIHADAFTDSTAKGASVYTLSRKGATSGMARYLAEKQNQADLIGGVYVEEDNELIRKLIVDLAMEGVLEHSFYVGKSILGEMGSVAQLHKNRVEQAGFLVLKSPKMVSILVETGFISNPQEERLLRSSSHQKKMASAIVKGVQSYFNQYPIPGTYHAQKRQASGQYAKHKIRSGDTLSAIADNYQVSVHAIRRMNGMKNDTIQVGKVLLIP